MPAAVIVEADGGSRGNPGPAGYGAVVLDAATRAVLAERSEAIGVATNNVAEYRGLIAGLRAALDVGARRVAVRLDSKLVVEQMTGAWRIRDVTLAALAAEAAELQLAFEEVSFEWIPRELNTHADRLANEAMDRAAGRPPRSAAPDAEPSDIAPGWAPPEGPRTRLVLLRHGSTVHSADQRFSGRNELPLDAAGREQAAALAERRFDDVAAVVSSPLRRAVQTAEAVAGALGLPVTINDDFAEVDFGSFEGLTSEEASAAFPAEVAAWHGSPDIAPPGGESFTALARRVQRGRNAVIATYPGQRVLVVTHVTPIKTLVRAALDAPPSSLYRMHLDIASVSALEYFADGGCSLRLFNDVSHLQPSRR